MYSLLLAASALAVVRAQQAGDLQPETHPSLTWYDCSSGGCSAVQGSIVIDSNWRWTHEVGEVTNCYEGNEWITTICDTQETCAESCALEGADYGATYGISTSGDALTLTFVTQHQYGTNIGSRVYLMADDQSYQMFDLLGNELAFDVDLSTVECGLNSALYFVAMEEDGGMSSGYNNAAGAEYGTGYCDAQCARDLKFVGGLANIEGWEPSSNDANAGVGELGACCAEIDVWESNAYAFALTPHPCDEVGYHVCGDGSLECGGTYSEDRFAGDCDANGCDYNPYRLGVTDFYGPGLTIDTGSVFTVITRFEQDSMYQIFVQNGQTYEVPAPGIAGISDEGVISEEMCQNMFDVFGDRARFFETGGWQGVVEAMNTPMVLVMSMWDDHYANMLWLDSNYPLDRDPSEPGVARGPCPESSGVPSEVESQYAGSTVTWSNIRFGPIGSTTDV